MLETAAEPVMDPLARVRNGDLVTAGLVLISTDATVAGVDAATLANELGIKRLTVRAIETCFGNRLSVDGPLAFSHQSG